MDSELMERIGSAPSEIIGSPTVDRVLIHIADSRFGRALSESAKAKAVA